ncbi:MAG: class II aldolase/adducin family protein [Chloroflexi bacterium]|nr:class II aldolase/adducin family protein [Chloroflexota bacterium]
MSIRWKRERQAVVAAAQGMASLGLTAGTGGNVSLRLPPGEDGEVLLAVTPTSVPYPDLTPQSIVVVDLDVNPVDGGGDGAPSSETLLHTEIYRRRPDAGAVIHTHSVFATVLAVTGSEIPPIIDEAVVYIGGPVKVSDYAFPGSQELADNVCAALEERNAAIIRNHGAVCVGSDLSEALSTCELLERLAQIYYYASVAGNVGILPADVVEAEVAIFDMRRQAHLKNISPRL